MLRKKGLNSINIIMSRDKTIDICKDKWLLNCFLEQHSLPHPKTYLRKISFPCFAKPRRGFGGMGCIRLSDSIAYSAYPSKKKSIYQEVLQGREYSVDTYCERTGQPTMIIPRERIRVSSGEVVLSRTIRIDSLIGIVKHICRELQFYGPVNFQCMEKGKQYLITDINPRICGGMTLSIKAGLNIPKQINEYGRTNRFNMNNNKWVEGLWMVRANQDFYFKGTNDEKK